MDKLTKERVEAAIECDRLLREGFEKYIKDFEWEQNNIDEFEEFVNEYFERFCENVDAEGWDEPVHKSVEFNYENKMIYVSYWCWIRDCGRIVKLCSFEIPIDNIAEVVESGKFEGLQKYLKEKNSDIRYLSFFSQK